VRYFPKSSRFLFPKIKKAKPKVKIRGTKANIDGNIKVNRYSSVRTSLGIDPDVLNPNGTKSKLMTTKMLIIDAYFSIMLF
jgi:hypothetical protein